MTWDALFTAALLAALGLDVWTKGLVQARFALGETLPLIPGFALTYVRNPGAAFSLLAGAPEGLRRPFFLGVAALAVVGVGWMLKQTPKADRLSRLALGLVLGGAVGNAIDRIHYGEVVDFIEVGVRSVYTWPIFNVADSAVCVGVGFLIYRSFFPLKGAEA